jgi:hypothetical protein
VVELSGLGRASGLPLEAVLSLPSRLTLLLVGYVCIFNLKVLFCLRIPDGPLVWLFRQSSVSINS